MPSVSAYCRSAAVSLGKHLPANPRSSVTTVCEAPMRGSRSSPSRTRSQSAPMAVARSWNSLKTVTLMARKQFADT